MNWFENPIDREETSKNANRINAIKFFCAKSEIVCVMDPKASAKAKRSHSQHGRRTHLSPAAIAQKKKAAQAAPEDKVRQQHSHALPSNWGRYDGGDEEVGSPDGTTSAKGEIEPKSKGADFAYLVDQARLQQQVLRTPVAPESLSLFDRVSIDFMQVASSIRTARGKNLLSRCEDDNFVIDDDLTSSFDVPFLKLDLHAIAARLSKLKLSERLFVEEDLLPEDLHCDESKGSSSSVESEIVGKLEVGRNLSATDSNPYSYVAKDVTGQTADDNTSAIPYSDFPQTSASHGNEEETGGVANLGELCNKREPEESVTNTSKSSTLKEEEAEAELNMLLESFSQMTHSGSIQVDLDKKPSSKVTLDDSVPIQWKSSLKIPGYINRKQPAEVELDMLLNSPSDNIFFGTDQRTLLDDSSNTRAPNSDVLYPMHQSLSRGAHVSSTNTEETFLDDLLAETSSIAKMPKHVAPTRQLGSMSSAINYPNPRSSSIDDLLANSSKSLGGQKSAATPNKAASEDSSSNLDPKAPIDDFDSWIHTF